MIKLNPIQLRPMPEWFEAREVWYNLLADRGCSRKQASVTCFRFILTDNSKLESFMLTQKQLKELLHYNPETGVFTWIVQKGSMPKGSLAKSKTINGYLCIRIFRKSYLQHRLAHLYMNGIFPKQVDHADHTRDNNKWENIKRPVNNQINSRNHTLRSTNTSGFTGVRFNETCGKNPWTSQIVVSGKNIILGYFDNKEAAIEARKKGNIKYGFHENHGAIK